MLITGINKRSDKTPGNPALDAMSHPGTIIMAIEIRKKIIVINEVKVSINNSELLFRIQTPPPTIHWSFDSSLVFIDRSFPSPHENPGFG